MEEYRFGNYLPIQIRRYIKLTFITGIIYLILKGTLLLCFPNAVFHPWLNLLEIVLSVFFVLCFLLFMLRRKYIDEKRKSIIVKGFVMNLLIILGVLII